MPHCIIEYADKLADKAQINETVNMLHTVLANSELFSKKTIKIRAIPINDYLIGDTAQPFIHVTIKILAGRTDRQKAALGESIVNSLKSNYDIDAISVEIIDLAKSYYKR